MASLVVRTGLFLALIGPAWVTGSLLLWRLMPDCQAGSIGWASGCTLLGIDMNGFMNLFVVVFLGSFLLSPVGVVVFLVGKARARRNAD